MNKDNKVVHFFNSLSEDVKKVIKDLAAEVKTENFADVAPPTDATGQAPSYTEVPLADGTVIKVSALEVGGEVLVVTPDGEMPAPEGELQLADGSVLEVVKEGEKSVIKEMKPAGQDMSKNAPLQEAKFAALEEKFAAFEATVLEENKKLKAEVESLKLKLSKNSAIVKNTVEVIEAMAAIPTAEPIKKPEVTATGKKKQSAVDVLFGKK